MNLDAFESQYAAILQEFRAKEIESLRAQIAQGLDSRTLLTPTSRVFRFRRQAEERLLEMLDRVKQFGRVQVRQELGRQ